jgi:hypothetical protein
MGDFDRLVEQQDQEIAQNGCVSPFTQMQLQALANGEPVPHINYNSPEMQRLTEQLRRTLHGGYDEEDDLLFYEEVSRG